MLGIKTTRKKVNKSIKYFTIMEQQSVSPHPPSSIGIESEKDLYIIEKKPDRGRTSLTFTVENSIGVLKDCLEVFAKKGVSLSQIESKPSVPFGYDFYVELDSVISENDLSSIIEDLNTSKCKKVTIMGAHNIAQLFWYPQRISDLDLFAHKVFQYGAELDADHPGFTDPDYRKRRLLISTIAANYKQYFLFKLLNLIKN